MSTRPQLSFWHIWNMCFGFIGIQMGFALQNANVSRIFQTLGASVEEIPILWIAAPLTGLIVQPIIGYMSDRTWTRFGRRRPYFFVGAVLSTFALFFMPHSPYLWIAAGMLWIMDASINVAMEPFRAYVGDNLPNSQRTLGFVVQSFFIGVGSVVASALPWIMTNWFDVPNTAEPGVIPPSVKYSFYIGGAVLFAAVMWTVYSTKEYTPEEMEKFDADVIDETSGVADYSKPTSFTSRGIIWLVATIVIGAAIFGLGDGSNEVQQLYFLCVCSFIYAIFLLIAGKMQNDNKNSSGFFRILFDLNNMPETMRQLTIVQFFSWFALFTMWIYTTSAVTSYHYGALDPASALYSDGADWVGVLFGGYNLFAAIAALLFIPHISKIIGMQKTHALCLFAGALGYVSILLIKDPTYLLVSMVGVGIAWASILSMPYAMLSTSIPSKKMGVFMGIFNFFIVIPQMLAAFILGLVVKSLFGGEAIYMMLVAAAFLVAAAIFSLRVKVAL